MVRRRSGMRPQAIAAGSVCCGLICAGLTAGLTPGASATAASPAAVGDAAARPADYPVAVTSTSGDVRGAQALVSGTGAATLSYPAGGKPPVIMLDYGTEVGGLPFFDVTRVAGTPVLNATYSESQQYLPAGDGAPGTGSNADPSRSDSYRLTAARFIVNTLVQGGQRFERITLAEPGSVTLRRAGVYATHAPAAEFSAGSFTSSDQELNQIWQLGANTMALDSLPSGALPAVWTVSAAGTRIPYSSADFYQDGGGWGNYTLTFAGQVVRNELSWTVRGGIGLTLTADNDTVGKPDTLVVSTPSPIFGAPPAVTGYPLPAGPVVRPGAWYTVKTVASGADITVYLDGKELRKVSAAGLSTGSVGFSNAAGAVALVKNLTVAAAQGKVLYRSSMTSPAVLGVFSAGTNPEPVIIDGGKRDRLVWGGDLLQAAPTVYYTSGSAAEVKGSLALFASYRTPQGEISSDLPVASQPGTGPVTALPGLGGFFSLSYSEDWLLALDEYYRYTGDKAFVRQEWPAVEAELRYLKANSDSKGLVETSASDGLDWAIDLQTGAATAYNALYYEGLSGMSALASALGYRAEAAQWARQAAAVKAAVNAVLFDAKTGVYDASTNSRGTYTQDANSLAVLFGIAPQGRAASIMKKLNVKLSTKNGPQAFSDGTGLTAVISPFMSAFDADAAFSIGQTAAALAVIRQVWGHMVKGQPFYSGGDFEALGLNGAPQSDIRTLAHAWSTGATSALSEYVLGVQPSAPGYARYLIQPQTSGLTWASGTVPTPCGTIAVSWSKQHGSLRLTVQVPRGSAGTVILPQAKGSHLTVQASPAVTVTAVSGSYRIAIGDGGQYTFTVSA